MIVDLDDLSDVIAYIDILNSIDPKLVRFKYNNKLLANESSKSNLEYGRELVKFLSTTPTGTPS